MNGAPVSRWTSEPGMAVVRLLGGLRRFGMAEQRLHGNTVRAVLDAVPIPVALLVPDGALNRDVEVLVNGRNVAFLDGLDTAVNDEDRVTIFLHGARGYPGG